MSADRYGRRSPDDRRVAVLVWAGEIRFGPPYFALELDGHDLGPRVFGDVRWSSGSRYLAAQEWHTTRESDGPLTSVVVFDLERGLEALAVPRTRGWAEATAFEDDVLAYTRQHKLGAGRGVERTGGRADVAALAGWRPIAPVPPA